MPTPQLLDPHKFDDKSGVPSTGTDAELHKLVVDMLKQGASDEEVQKFVRKIDAYKDPTSAHINGALSGIAPGLLTGLIGIPMMFKDAVVDGVSMLQGKDPENAKAFVESMHSFVPKLREMDPYEQAKAISELASSFAAGGAESGGVFKYRKPLAKTVGTGLIKVSEHPNAIRLASGSTLIGRTLAGDVTGATAAAAAGAIPEVSGALGRKLYRYGTNGVEYMNEAEKLEAQKAKAIESAMSGLEPSVPSISKSTSTKNPDGSRTTMSQSFKKPDAASKIPVPEGLTATEEASFREIKSANSQIPDAVILRTIRGTSANPIASAAPAGRPAIRVTGSPAAPAIAPEIQARLTDTAPVERRVNAGQAPAGVERRTAVSDGPPATGSIAERAAALRKENPAVDQEAATMRAQAAESGRGGTALLEAPPVEAPAIDAPVAGVPDNYMTDTDVANIGEHASEMGNKTLQTLRDAGADVPEGGLQSTHDIDRVVATTPRNLHMGSDASPKEIAADVRVRAQGGGGIRVTGSRPNEPISLVKGEPLPLNEEAQKVLKQYIAENPEVDPAVAEAHLRKLMGSEE